MEQSGRLRHGLAAALVTSFFLVGALVTLSACNTTAGAGQDVSAAGKAVTNSADTVKSKLP